MTATATKIDFTATVTTNREIAPGFWRMAFHLPTLDEALVFSPGQFCQVRPHAGSLNPLLRRPFVACTQWTDGFDIVYQTIGDGTAALAALTDGDAVEIIAPLGTPYQLPTAGSVSILIGGGVGTPALVLLAQHIHAAGGEVQTAIGARSAESVLNFAELSAASTSCLVATDDGSTGHHGNAVEVAEEMLAAIFAADAARPVTLYACGPHLMLRAAVGLAAAHKLSVQVSLEERMACGFGVCVGCPVGVRDADGEEIHNLRVCADGPVFDGHRVQW